MTLVSGWELGNYFLYSREREERKQTVEVRKAVVKLTLLKAARS